MKQHVRALLFIINSIPEPVICYDNNLLITLLNTAAGKLLGWTEKEADGHSIVELLKMANPLESWDKVMAKINKNGIWAGESTYHTRSGRPITIFSTVSYLKDVYDKITGGFVVITDLTEKKKAEAAILILNTQLENSIKERTSAAIVSEQIFNDLFKRNPGPMFITDISGLHFLDVNDQALQQYGYRHEEFLALTLSDIGADGGKILMQAENPCNMVTVGDNKEICRHRTKNGAVIRVEITVHNIVFEGRQARLAYTNDVSESIEAKEKLILDEEQLRHTLDNMQEGVQIHDFNWKYIYVNHSLVKYSQYRRAELLGHTLMQKYPGIEQTRLFRVLERSMRLRTTEQMETPFIFPDGTKKDFQLSIQPVPEGIFILSIDISERKRVEAELVLSEENYRTMMERVSDGFVAIDANWRYTYVNRKAGQIFGRCPEALVGKHSLTEFPEGSNRPFFDACRKAMDQQHHVYLEAYYAPLDLWLENNIYPSADGLSIFFRDVSARKKDEQKREFDRNNLHALINNTVDLMWSVDLHFTIISCNHAFDKRFSRSSKITSAEDGIAAATAITDQLFAYKKFYERAFTGESFTIEQPGPGANNLSEISFYPIYEGCTVIGTACFSRDITERRKAEEFLTTILSEKKATAARMTAITNALPASVALLNSEGLILEVNDSWRNFIGSNGFMGRDYAINDNYLVLTNQAAGEQQKDGKEVSEGLAAVLNGEAKDFVYEYSCDAPEAKKCFRIIANRMPGNETAGAVVMHIDITELRRLEEERLTGKIEQQKTISRAMLQAQERERNHIGLELHDNITQLLAAIKMKLQYAIEGDNLNIPAVRDCINHVEDALIETRGLSHLMVMPRFSDTSFHEAVEQLAAIYRNTARTILVDTGSLEEKKAPEGIKETLYRILQEQLNNIEKYAKASLVMIKVGTGATHFNMTIEDNGVGFDRNKKQNGIGLINIKNRSESYNGEMKILTAPEKGCKLSVDIPLQQS